MWKHFSILSDFPDNVYRHVCEIQQTVFQHKFYIHSTACCIIEKLLLNRNLLISLHRIYSSFPSLSDIIISIRPWYCRGNQRSKSLNPLSIFIWGKKTEKFKWKINWCRWKRDCLVTWQGDGNGKITNVDYVGSKRNINSESHQENRNKKWQTSEGRIRKMHSFFNSFFSTRCDTF